MKIIFAGEVRLTERVQALATLLAQAGHEVSVCAAASVTAPNMRKATGIQIRRIPSLLPGQRGGWAYSLLTVFTIWRAQPQVVHLFGWKMAALAPFLRLLLPEAVMVWTVDTLTRRADWLTAAVAQRAAAACNTVTVARRDVQWHLLQRTGVRAEYIPDGYLDVPTPLVSPRRWGLWSDRYVLTTANTWEELAWIGRAYAVTKTRKKLVAISPELQGAREFARAFPFVKLVPTEGARVRQSLMNASALIVLGSSRDDSRTILGAMASGKPVISLTEPFHEETLGVTARYVREGEVEGLSRALREEFRALSTQKRSSRRSRRRAETHFSWARIVHDYLHTYQPLTRYVPLDSAQSVKFTKPALQ